MEGESAELCGIPGEHSEPITKEEFNRLVSQVKYYHYRPQQRAITRVEELLVKHHDILTGHIEEDKLFHARIGGAKWAIYGIFACLAALLPLLFGLIKALHELGIF